MNVSPPGWCSARFGRQPKRSFTEAARCITCITCISAFCSNPGCGLGLKSKIRQIQKSLQMHKPDCSAKARFKSRHRRSAHRSDGLVNSSPAQGLLTNSGANRPSIAGEFDSRSRRNRSRTPSASAAVRSARRSLRSVQGKEVAGQAESKCRRAGCVSQWVLADRAIRPLAGTTMIHLDRAPIWIDLPRVLLGRSLSGYRECPRRPMNKGGEENQQKTSDAKREPACLARIDGR